MNSFNTTHDQGIFAARSRSQRGGTESIIDNHDLNMLDSNITSSLTSRPDGKPDDSKDPTHSCHDTSPNSRSHYTAPGSGSSRSPPDRGHILPTSAVNQGSSSRADSGDPSRNFSEPDNPQEEVLGSGPSGRVPTRCMDCESDAGPSHARPMPQTPPHRQPALVCPGAPRKPSGRPLRGYHMDFLDTKETSIPSDPGDAELERWFEDMVLETPPACFSDNPQNRLQPALEGYTRVELALAQGQLTLNAENTIPNSSFTPQDSTHNAINDPSSSPLLSNTVSSTSDTEIDNDPGIQRILEELPPYLQILVRELMLQRDRLMTLRAAVQEFREEANLEVGGEEWRMLGEIIDKSEALVKTLQENVMENIDEKDWKGWSRNYFMSPL